jgi:hypothetical protein
MADTAVTYGSRAELANLGRTPSGFTERYRQDSASSLSSLSDVGGLVEEDVDPAGADKAAEIALAEKFPLPSFVDLPDKEAELAVGDKTEVSLEQRHPRRNVSWYGLPEEELSEEIIDAYEFPQRRTCFLFTACERIIGRRRN